MDLVFLLKKVVNKLEKLKIPYMVTGGIAVSFWGLPRTTHDVDIVVKIREEDKNRVIRAFGKEFYISEKAVTEAIKNQFTFNIVHYKSGLKIDFWLAKETDFGDLEFKRRQKRKVFGKEIYFISPEDLILEKLLWFKKSQSTRHLEDTEGIIKISKPDLDYIKNWAKKHSTIEILNGILKKERKDFVV